MKYPLISLLLGISMNLFSQETLFDLVKSNDRKAVKAYEGSVNLRDGNKATPLMWAVYASDEKMVKLLVKKGADPHLKGWIIIRDSIAEYDLIYGSCMALAAGAGKTGLLKYMVRKLGISPDDREINLQVNLENGWTALHWAAYTGNTDAAEFLIREGADIDAVAPTDNNQTPLHFAVAAQHAEMVDMLLEAGADCNRTDWLGVSVLSYAFQQGSREMVKLLLHYGARFDDREHKILSDELHKVFGISDKSEL